MTKRTLLLSVAAMGLVTTSVVEARREPRRSFTPVRHLTEARVDERFHVGPPPPTRDEQLRPLPSFYAPPGSPGSNGRGVHSSIWNRVRHHDWVQQQRALVRLALHASMPTQPTAGPKTIVIVDRRTPPTTAPATTAATARPTTHGPIIASIRIRD